MNNKSKINVYWNKNSENKQKYTGVYPMGNGGFYEIMYRHFWELKHLKSKIDLNKSKCFLELGCGNGRWALSLATKVNKYIGVDINKNGLEYAKKQATKKGLSNITFIENNILDFNWNFKEKIDILYLSGVTQYLQNIEIIQILNNLSSSFSKNIIIIDRSTVNSSKTIENNSSNYFSIYRSPKDLISIYTNLDFKLVYQKRSYVFLRNTKKIRYENSKLTKLMLKLATISFYFYKYLSLLTNFITKKHLDVYTEPYNNKYMSHDFFILKTNDK